MSANITDLPVELLLHLFENLGVSDRQVTSAVCQKWAAVSDRVTFNKKDEKLVLNDPRLIKSHLNIFADGFKTIRTLSFTDNVCLFLLTNCDKFWSTMARTVTEVEFVRTRFLSNDILCYILKRLPKLRSVKLYAPCFTSWNLFKDNKSLITPTNHAELAPTLKSITHLTINDAGINNENFRNLISALPNLTSLNTMSLCFKEVPIHEKCLSRSCLMDILREKATKLKELELKSVTDSFLKRITEVNGLQLQSCSFQLFNVRSTTLYDFMAKQTSLKEVKFFISRDETNLRDHMQNIVPLNELKLDPMCPVSLETLRIPKTLEKLTVTATYPFSCASYQNPNLTELHLTQMHTDTTDFCNTIRSFPNLRSFTYSGAGLDADDVELICRGLPYLRNLCLERCQKLGPRSDLSAINRLCGLQHLKLWHGNFTADDFTELALLELKSIGISEVADLTMNGLVKLCKRCSSLEQVKIITVNEVDGLDVTLLKTSFPRLKTVKAKPSRAQWDLSDAGFVFDR